MYDNHIGKYLYGKLCQHTPMQVYVHVALGDRNHTISPWQYWMNLTGFSSGIISCQP